MWLVTLYAFLAATAVCVLMSLMALGRGIRGGFRTGLLVFIPAWLVLNVVFAYAVHRTAYSIESRDPFCVSCHLHQGELTRFHDTQSPVALDLAGYHARHGQAFTCIACHVGEGVGGPLHSTYVLLVDTPRSIRSPTRPVRSAIGPGRSVGSTPRRSTRNTRRTASNAIRPTRAPTRRSASSTTSDGRVREPNGA